MHLLRVWRTHLLRGAAVAVITPVAIFAAALTVGATGGGLRGLGALTQAMTGPAVPAVEPTSERNREGETGRLLERSMPARRDRAGSASRTGARPAALRESPGGSPGRDDGDRRRGSREPQPPDRQPPAPAPSPDPPEPSAVRRLGDSANEVTRRVPVVGEPASEVVDAIVDTVESVPPRGVRVP